MASFLKFQGDTHLDNRTLCLLPVLKDVISDIADRCLASLLNPPNFLPLLTSPLLHARVPPTVLVRQVGSRTESPRPEPNTDRLHREPTASTVLNP